VAASRRQVTANRQARATAPAPAHAGSPPWWVVVILLVLAIAAGLIGLYGLWQFWPSATVLQQNTVSRANFFGFHKLITPDERMFIVVAIAGALGGLLHSTRSFVWYVGHGGLKWRWLPFYIATILIGAGIATIVYVVFRGGLFSGKATSSDVNPYGFVAIAALVGLFTEQALMMLQKVATDIFAAPPEGADQAGGDSPPPAAAAAETGGATAVTATGATLGGHVTPGGGQTSYYFEYGPTPGYGSETPPVDAPGSDPADVSAQVDGLQAGTLYHYRLVATSGDVDVPGHDATFTTLAAKD